MNDSSRASALSGMASTCADAPIQAALTVSECRCEYRKDPLGIDATRPRLSWILAGDRRGEIQTAYRVLVASSPELLRNDQGDLWDSGQVLSDQSVQVQYAGKALTSGMQCWWKVRVWDKAGQPSAWTESAHWAMGLLKPEDWQAHWIGAPGAGPTTSILPCVYLRKAFVADRPVTRATVYATAAGLYELHLNGARVGDAFFTPGWTEYDKRLYYQTYDVTAQLRRGDNVLGAILGDGWFGLHHDGRGRLALLVQLRVDFTDGTSQLVATDDSWKAASDGPILMSDIYQGENYDARKELPGWDRAGFNAAAWQPVSTTPFSFTPRRVDVTQKVRQAVRDNSVSIPVNNDQFGDPAANMVKTLRVKYRVGDKEFSKDVGENQVLELRGDRDQGLTIDRADYGINVRPTKIATVPRQAHPGVPVRQTQEIKPIQLTEPQPGIHVYDLGQNFSGWARLKIQGQAGQKVVLRFAEMLNPDGTIYTANLRSAKCTDTYILRGGGDEVWEPRFTFHGFRYVELTGCSGKPSLDTLTGVVLQSDAPTTGSFECSNPMLNQLYKNIVWSQRSNYLEVPTDCPQRDERMGWSGDAQVFVGTGAYNMDVAAFFTSWMNTLNDAQNAQGGYPSIAPDKLIWNVPVSAGWGDAGIICPWTIYRVYGDTRILRDHYSEMAKWIVYLEQHSQGYLRPAEGFADWLNMGAHFPPEVIGTAYLAYSTSLMVKIARVLDKPADAARYEALLANIKTAFNRAYVAEDGKIKGHTQTAYAMALRFDLLPPDKRTLAAKHLMNLIEERQGHVSIGFLGVNLILPALTDIGRTEMACQLLQNETYPSWGYPIKHGATTIWERWDGWTAEKGFQDPGMNSFNHYAYGSCGEWMFTTLAGIDTDGPGFKRIVIHPRPGGGIAYAKASYDSIHGRIATHWRQQANAFTLSVTIPANTTARVYIPCADAASVTESGKAAAQSEGVKFLRMEDGAALYEIGSGNYQFSSILGRAL